MKNNIIYVATLIKDGVRIIVGSTFSMNFNDRKKLYKYIVYQTGIRVGALLTNYVEDFTFIKVADNIILKIDSTHLLQ